MPMLLNLSILLLAISAADPAGAVQATAAKSSVWTGEVELGGVSTSGNTKSRNLNASLTVENTHDRWNHKAAFTAYYADRDDGEARIYAGSLSSVYKFSKFDYIVGAFEYENDNASGYEYRFHESIGYGRVLAENDAVTLKFEAGPGGRHSKLEAGERTDELILRAAVNFGWKISGSSTFTENIVVVSGGEGTVTESVTALRSSVIGALAMKLSFKAKWNSDPPEDKGNTDTITSVTLVYGF